MNIRSLLFSKKNQSESRHQKRERLQRMEKRVLCRMYTMSKSVEIKMKFVDNVLRELR